MKASALFLIGCLLGAAPQAMAQTAPNYRLVKTIPIGAPDRWDYVVYDNGRAYVAHADVLTVVDVQAGKVAGTLQVGGVTHGFARRAGTGQRLYR